jgi:hypothetical protein
MRHVRPILALVVISAIAVACSSPGAGSSGPSSGASSDASQGAASQPAASTGGGGAGANGSITYRISGGYTASGELPYVALGVSLFDTGQGGWVAYFGASTGGGAVIQLNTSPNSIANFGDGTIVVIGTKATGCTFTFDKNDSGGLKGKVECHGTQGFKVSDSSPVTVDFTANWDAHP